MYIHIPQQQASKKASELSDQLVEVVREARKSDKTLNRMDVRQALQLTGHKLREELGGMSNKTQLLILGGILVVILVAGLVKALLFQ